MRRPFASPAPYDAWLSRDDDYTDDGRPGDYGSCLQQAARENARAEARRLERERKARPMKLYEITRDEWEGIFAKVGQ